VIFGAPFGDEQHASGWSHTGGVGRRGLALTLMLVGLSVAAGASADASGASVETLHVLVARVTWESQPFSDAQVDSAMQAAAGFFDTGSFGQVSVSYAQTRWLKVLSGPPACGFTDAPTLGSHLAPLVAAAGYDLTAYDRLVFLLPSSNCGYAGVYEPEGIILNGVLNAGLVVHELAESLGMGDPGVVTCRYTASNHFCRVSGAGAPWDVMAADCCTEINGSTAVGDFGALQKARAGWLTSITHIQSAGTYTLGALEQPAGVPQALVIQTAGYQYWVDHREAIGNDAYLAADPQSGVTSGFAVYREVGDPDLTQNREYPLIPDYLLPQGRHNRYVTAPGQTFTLPNIFELTALAHRDDEVTIRFRWLDHTKPATPALSVVTDSGSANVTWPSVRDTGSGVKQYLVSIDNSTPTALPAQPARPNYHDQIAGLTAGRHTISVIAADYAGNQSAPARRTVTIT